ncbi:hypothetical protein AA106556_0662 [Neokomagataea tanensis NBRC 106556]|uniref:DUF4159 domain-containing protein n=2 Tax=Acetobacteraceae TaxID=433 RepID=A0ABQ0QHN1_9PROT|nr:hypothetical protein AA106556_0662 [Neokomagataea tanensis NBRC 106556]
MLHHLQPQPWPIDRAALITRLNAQPHPTENLLFISDGIATEHDRALLHSIPSYATQSDLRWPLCDIALLTIHNTADHTHHASILQPQSCTPHTLTLHAVSQQGGTLTSVTLPSQTDTALPIAPALRRQLDHFTLEGDYGLAGQYYLGDTGHRRPVGVLPTPGDATPLTGSAFFLNQALDSVAERHSVPSTALTTTPLSVLIATDGALSGDSTREHVLAWVKQGGTLIRFAGPGLAAQPPAQSPDQNNGDTTGNTTDPLIAVPLMNGLRQLGGPMSWGKPQELAEFSSKSPFYGLPIPTDVTVTKQVLAQPTDDLNNHVWAALKDGTPLVTAHNYGNGEIILFHITASPDWSNLPLSGLFPSMLERLIARSAGIPQAETGTLPLWRAFDDQGSLITPPPAAQPLTMATIANTSVTIHHPAGLYGPIHGTHALNLGDNAPPLSAAPLFGTPITPDGLQRHTSLTPFALLAGLGVLIIDMLLSLYRRGLLRRRTALLVLTLCSITAIPAQADDAAASSNAPAGALQTHLAYIETGNPEIDNVSRMGLQGLSDYTSTRSSALLGAPIGVQPGRDDLAFYPLLYWPITTDLQTDPTRTKALNSFMEHGGILLMDELGAGTDLDPGHSNAIRAALKRATDGLMVPPLAKLNDQHVLSHTFYLMHGTYPGRIAGQPVYVAQTGDEANDGVSPVIIGNAGWAYAWAIDNTGNHPYATIPGGDDQRTIAYRFGLNMIVYALTGSYKSDQAHYPEMLHRLGSNVPPNNPSDDTDGDDTP